MNLSVGKKVLFALGQFGLVLCAFGIGNLFVSFFVTRTFIETSPIQSFIYQGYFFGYFTVAGLIIALSKIFDSFAGLLFGFASDRNTMKKGRRTGFMILAVLPLAVFSVLVFFPPSKDSFLFNSAYVCMCTILFYLFLSLYATPYLALLAELGKSAQERLHLSALLACATALATLFGNRMLYFIQQSNLVLGFSPIASFRIIVSVYALVSCICMLLPSVCIEENNYCSSVPVTDSFGVSLKAVLKDSYFKPFFIADLMYRLALAFTIAGFSYYVTVLLGLSPKTTAFFLLLIFLVNVLLYGPVCFVTRLMGKRNVLLSSFFVFLIVLTLAVFAGKVPFDPFIQGIVLSVLFAIPLSVFSVVPNALVSDLVFASERKTGIQRGGMYFGVQSMSKKIAHLLSALLFSSIMSIGSTSTQIAGHAGLRLTLISAALFSVIGFLFLLGYHEKEVTVLLDTND